VEIDLYNDFSTSFVGAVDNSDGVGLPRPTPLLPNWIQDGSPPNGWGGGSTSFRYIRGGWVHGGYAYFCVQSTGGTGRGIYRYSLSGTDPVTMTYDSYVSLSSILTGATYWCLSTHCAFYDGSKVVLVGMNTGAGYHSNVIGQWTVSNWPFTSTNADWISSLPTYVGGYVSDAAVYEPCCALGANDFYVSSYRAGQVHIVSRSDGSFSGPMVWRAFYELTASAYVLCEHGDGKPFAGAYHAGGNLSLWNTSTPTAWAEDTVIWPSAGSVYTTPQHIFKRATQALNNGYYAEKYNDITRYELTLLGYPSTTIGAWTGIYNRGLLLHDTGTGAYIEAPIPINTYLRAIPRAILTNNFHRFVEINSLPYFLAWNQETRDHEAENPGGNATTFYGISACPVGPGKVTYSKTISVGTTGKPTGLFFSIPASKGNYSRSEHYSKHRIRLRVNGGAWSDWRSGEQELNNLQSVVNGKNVWPSEFLSGQTIDIEHELSSGWPYDWETVKGNPGESGDPITPNVISADNGPPRHIRAILRLDPKELGGGLF